MKLLVVLSAVFALGAGKPSLLHTPIHHQYHAQDELGQYTYGYSGGPSAKVESRTADGVTRGSYSYIDSNGIVQQVNYAADPVNGFRVAASNLPLAPAAPVVPIAAAPVAPVVPAVALPTPVVDTPEVAAAKAEHLAAKAAAEAKVDAPVVAAPVPAVVAPVPVAETPEVVAEKARHLAAVEVAKVNVATAVDDSHLHDDGSYKINPLEDDGQYRGEPVNVAVVNSALGPVATVVSADDSLLHDDGSYKINPFEDDGQYRGEKIAVVGTNYINTIPAARTVVAGNLLPGLRHSYAYSAPAYYGSRYAVATPAIHRVAYSTPLVAPSVIPAAHRFLQYHSQDEHGQYTYGYAGGLSSKHETKTADGITRGGYSYIDANGLVQSVAYVSDPINGFRVAATNLPIAHQ